MSLTVKLTEEEQTRLDVIASAMKVGGKSDVVRALINEKFESLQNDKTIVERRGGHPQYLLDCASDLSERTKRKGIVNEQLTAKETLRKS